MRRSTFISSLGSLALLPLMKQSLSLSELSSQVEKLASTETMPALFIGHGNPMNAIWNNDFTKALSRVGAALPKAQAILVISAHWETNGTMVSSTAQPQTIYDFGGFPDELYHVNYPAPGAPEFAHELAERLKDRSLTEDNTMGLDHGAWTVLKHLVPSAKLPVFQLSLDARKTPAQHFELARELAWLRQHGVILLGSGNIVHNLRRAVFNDVHAKVFDWAQEFDSKVKDRILQRDFASLLDYEKFGAAARLAVPTNEHYLPMLYILATSQSKEDIRMLYEGTQHGSISMRCFQLGA